MAWVELSDVKNDLGIDASDTRDDARITQALNAALSYVEEVRPGFNWDEESSSELPDPTDHMLLGIIRLAGRWKDKDNLVELGEMGTRTLPSVDADIARMLGIGKFRKASVSFA